MPWFDCYVLHAKLMLIPGRIGRYIQISWDPFVHLETSCAKPFSLLSVSPFISCRFCYLSCLPSEVGQKLCLVTFQSWRPENQLGLCKTLSQHNLVVDCFRRLSQGLNAGECLVGIKKGLAPTVIADVLQAFLVLYSPIW